MTSVRICLGALVMAVALAACTKQGAGDATGLPADVKLQAAQGGPSGPAVPALFASIPADTPYLMASVEPVSPGLWAKLEQAFKPVIDMVAAKSQEERGKNKLFDAVLTEMAGKWTAAGLESLGLSAQPRFVMYGLGLQPFVARVAIKDGKTVRATFERIAARAGERLPPATIRGGRSYWQNTGKDGTSIVISIGDRELVAAVGKARDVEAKLDLILGLQKPARNMADGALIKQLMAGHGLGGQMIGFADTRQLASKALEAVSGLPGPPSPACTGEIDRLSAKLPRLVVGYSELSGSRIAGSFVVEMAPDLLAELRALKTELPGLGAVMSGHPIMAFAAALDLARAQELGVAAAANLRQLGAACGLGSLVNGAAQVVRQLSRPLPDLATRISGAAVVVNDIVMRAGDHSGTPEKIEGVLLVASPDARALFGKAIELEPMVKSLGIQVDGKLHDLRMPLPVFRAPAVGIGERVIVVTAGDSQRGTGDQLIAARGGDKAPLFTAIYDFPRLMDFTERNGDLDRETADPDVRAFLASLKDVFGNVSSTLDVTDRGLVMWSAVELR
jgi:hypothetical protein